ncbi:MAG: hypothetical protein ACK5QX_09150 [bacterium]|jgi:hypothetical protein
MKTENERIEANYQVLINNTLDNPLVLKWDGKEYKVNKPLDQSGKYVDQTIAVELFDALAVIIDCQINPSKSLANLNSSIDNARKILLKSITK